MLVPPSPIWFDVTPQGKLTQTQDDFEYARQLLEKDSEEYERNQSDRGFIHKILAAGTTADKLSTLTLLAQQSPVHNTKALQSLVQLGQKKSRSEALKALRAFGDWWSAGGAPDRKLRYWRDQPAKANSDAQRVLYYFEDWLKKLFWNVLQTLERLSLDPLPYVRTQATSLIHAILSSKPEQEHNLLRLLVNKLGDSSKQLASRASYHLLQLLEPHPAMKMVIVGEIASLILRAPLSTSAKVHVDKAQDSAGINSHARYYATITLNQLVLSHSEQDTQLARKLIQIYFDLFNVLLRIQKISPQEEKHQTPERVKGRQEMKKDKTKRQERQEREQLSSNPNEKGERAFVEMKEGHERFISAILTGLHRAVPYAALGASGFEMHISTLFKLTHESTFNISLQAMLLIHSLLATALPTVSPSLDNKAGSEYTTESNMQSRFLRTIYTSLHDPRLRASSKKSLYLNLLLKVMNYPYHSSSALAAKNQERETQVRRSFWRRLVSVAVAGTGMAGENEVVCGSMFVLGEVSSRVSDLKNIGKEFPKEQTAYRRVNGKKDPVGKSSQREGEYDPRKREPEFARADLTPIWELTTLSNHYHPSVALHAQQLLDGRPVTANADLSLNTLSHFLDRFVYKNPKKPSARGNSSMQPSAILSTKKHARDRGVWVGEGAILEAMMNEDQFRKRKVGSIPVDQIFFHKFFSQKCTNEQSRGKQAGTGNKRIDSDDDSGFEDIVGNEGEDEEDEEREKEIWKAMQASMPRTGDENDDDDMGEDVGDSDSSNDEDSNGSSVRNGNDVEGGLDFPESEDDLLDSDAELPETLFDSDGGLPSESESEEWGGVAVNPGQKRKSDQRSQVTFSSGAEAKDGLRKKRKLKHLPTFASFEDYQRLIDQTPDDNI